MTSLANNRRPVDQGAGLGLQGAEGEGQGQLAAVLRSQRLEDWLTPFPHGGRQVPTGGLGARHMRRIPFRKPLLDMKGLMEAANKIARHYKRSSDRDVRLVGLASLYAACLKSGSRQPIADVAKQSRLKISQVRDAVHQARTAGLLTASRGQGFAGGELTPRALSLMAQGRRRRTGGRK